MRRMSAALVGLVLLLSGLLAAPALAVMPDEVLSDPALESRARALSRDLRCLVCQNQSIDDSNAGLARDLRVLVRERLTAGDTDAQVIDYVVARYGDYVLLRPPVNERTLALWAAPGVIVLLSGGLVLFWLIRRPRVAGEAVALSAQEEARLAKVLADMDTVSRHGLGKGEAPPARGTGGRAAAAAAGRRETGR